MQWQTALCLRTSSRSSLAGVLRLFSLPPGIAFIFVFTHFHRILPRWHPSPKTREERISNVNIALKALRRSVNLDGVSAELVVDGNADTILTLIWRIIQTYHLARVRQIGKPPFFGLFEQPSQKIAYFRKEILHWLQSEKIKVYNLTHEYAI